MKIKLDVIERRAICGLMKLFALKEENQQAKIFWWDMAQRFLPNQLEGQFRRKEIEILLDLLTKAVETTTKSMRHMPLNCEQLIRADAVEKILSRIKEKLETKLKGESQDGI
jgi:hypothetical protein